MTIALKVRVKGLQFLAGSIGIKFYDLGLGNSCFTPKAEATNFKNKTFMGQRTLSESEKQTTEWKKILENHIW